MVSTQEIFFIIIWLQQYARSDWLLSGNYFLVMTGHYELFFFSSKFAQDLGVTKTKIVSFSKKLLLLSLLVSIARPGFSSMNRTSNDLLRAQTDIGNASGFFSRAENAI